MLLDQHLPDLDGAETLSHMRELPGAGDAHVVVISGDLDEDARWRFGVLGVEEFLRKPVELRELVDTIARVARSYGLLAPESPRSDRPPDGNPGEGTQGGDI